MGSRVEKHSHTLLVEGNPRPPRPRAQAAAESLEQWMTFLAESPDAARGERHQFLVWGVVADPLPALHNLDAYLVEPIRSGTAPITAV